jgi:hypothetical protein
MSETSQINCDSMAEVAGAYFAWCLGRAQLCLDQSNANEALEWCSAAAGSASGIGFFGFLASSELEDLIREAARGLAIPPSRPRPETPNRLLHVFTEAYATLGHTNLCRRWIELDSLHGRHDVILLSQCDPGPENLRSLVEGRGGSLKRLDPSLALLERAALLRQAAFDTADIVVLHAHMHDVIPAAAFSAPGGPPVVYVNHADHAFWTGRSVADAVFDIRDSGHAWTESYRRVSRGRIVPIPLTDASQGAAQRTPAGQLEARKQLGLPEAATILLTVGNAFKYEPMGGLDFTDVARRILQEHPQARLVAVGPGRRGQWKQAALATKGRLMPMGVHHDLASFHRAADIYLEGFPSGSLTACLEAGLAGLPCVRAPELVPLPCASDGVAFDAVPRPTGIEDYIARARILIQDRAGREEQGASLRRRIVGNHCGPGWERQLGAACKAVPNSHSVYLDPAPVPVPREARDFLIRQMNRGSAGRASEAMAMRMLSIVPERRLLDDSLCRSCLDSLNQRGLLGHDAVPGESRGVQERMRRITAGARADALLRAARLEIIMKHKAAAISKAWLGLRHDFRKWKEPDTLRILAHCILP